MSRPSFTRISRLTPPLLMAALCLLLSGPALAEQSIDRVFGGITAEDGEHYGSLETVNGGITIGDHATVRSAETVNGGIRIGSESEVGSAETVNGGISVGADSHVRNLETVNGGIRLRRGVQVKNDVETVNGGITTAAKVAIGGDVETVNGGIELLASTVAGSVTTVSGDITVDEGSVVEGELRVRKPSSWWNSWGNSHSKRNRKPRITLGPGSEVKGPLVFEREVELRIHASAKHGPITGATAEAYGESAPAQR